MDKVKLYQKAMDTYGLENQTRMVFEEMAELQKELCKALRGMINTKNIAEEIKISKLNRLENNLEILNPRCYSSI